MAEGNRKRVLAALAFSGYAKGIFSFAADIARCVDGDLLVASIINKRDVESVRTISAMGYEVDGEHYIQTVREDRERLLAGIAASAGVELNGIRKVFRVGNPVEELLRIIVEERVDIVVMGPKGRSDLETALLGSVAEKVFRRSPATVISYRDAAIREQFERRIELG